MIYIDSTAMGANESAASYRNVLSEGVLNWSSQAADGFAANALGPQTYDYWVPSSVPATIGVVMASPVECDTAALIGHNLHSLGCTAHVEASNDGLAWVTLASVTPDSDDDLILLFSDLTGAEYSQWRWRITGGTPPAISIAWIGPRLMFPMGVQASHTPVAYGLTVDLSTSQSITGQYIGSYIERKGGGAAISLAPQERHWVQTKAQPFIAHYNAGKPFLWMSCPDKLPEDGHYVWRSGGTLGGSFNAGSMSVDMSMEVQAFVA